MQPRCVPLFFDDDVEEIEDYRPGGFHPISIGDTFDDGRYKILHRLGFGGSSTVWLARDLWEGRDRGQIVALKAMRSDVSLSNNPELAIAQRLEIYFPGSDLQTVDHHFLVQGPNGSHLFLIFPLAGPNILSMHDSRGRGAGSRRLRADLARKVAKQVAMAIYNMHCRGIVHGGK